MKKINHKKLALSIVASSLFMANSVYAENDSIEGMGDLPGSSFYSYARGISGDGSVVVGDSYSTNGYEAFRWTSAGGMEGLGVSSARGVSNDGSVIVGQSGVKADIEEFNEVLTIFIKEKE